MFRWEIEYQFGTYSGTMSVETESEDQEVAVAKMWRLLRPHMSLGMAYQSARVLSCEEVTA